MEKIVAPFAISGITKAWAEVARELRSMTPKQRTQTLISAGILTRSGRVAKPYIGVIESKKRSSRKVVK